MNSREKLRNNFSHFHKLPFLSRHTVTGAVISCFVVWMTTWNNCTSHFGSYHFYRDKQISIHYSDQCRKRRKNGANIHRNFRHISIRQFPRSCNFCRGTFMPHPVHTYSSSIRPSFSRSVQPTLAARAGEVFTRR